MTSLEWVLSALFGAAAALSLWLGHEYRLIKQSLIHQKAGAANVPLGPEARTELAPFGSISEPPPLASQSSQDSHKATADLLSSISRHLIDHDHSIMVSMAGVAECTTEASMSILGVAKRLSTNTVELSHCLVSIHEQSRLMREEIIMASAAVIKAAGLLLQMPDKIAPIDKTEPLASQMIDSVQALESHHATIFGYFDAELKTVAERYEGISEDLSELFGRVQFEDIVKQKIQRAMAALEFRELLLRDAIKAFPMESTQAVLVKLEGALKDNLHAYLSAESYHAAVGRSDRGLSADSDQPKIELF